jgi:hypothetical protein
MVEAVKQINRLLRHQAHQYFLLQHPPQQQQQLQQHQGLPAPIQPPQAQEPPLPPPPPHAAPPAVDAQPAALHDAEAAQRAAVARDAVGVLRRTPRVPAIGGRCPSTWEASHQEWELCELSTFLLHDQKGWPRVSRTRYNKRRAIHEELLRMSLSRLDLDLAGVASWLDDIRGERTLTNHLVSIRQNNPQVHRRVVHARRRHIRQPARRQTQPPAQERTQPSTQQRRTQPPGQRRTQPPAQQQTFPRRPGFQGPNLRAVRDAAAHQARLATDQARLLLLQRSRLPAQQRPQQPPPSPVIQGTPGISRLVATSRHLAAIAQDKADSQHRLLQAERRCALPRQSDVLDEDVLRGFT